MKTELWFHEEYGIYVYDVFDNYETRVVVSLFHPPEKSQWSNYTYMGLFHNNQNLNLRITSLEEALILILRYGLLRTPNLIDKRIEDFLDE
jgi:hypothetical protein